MIDEVDEPAPLWHTDITECRTAEGKLYRCAIKDVFFNRIVSYSRMKSRLAVQTLDNAVAMRGDVACCIVHSGGGSQFRSRGFLRGLATRRMIGSMGRVGSSGGNAPVQSFFAPLHKTFSTAARGGHPRTTAHCDRYLDRTDLPPPPPSSPARLGRSRPIEFQTIMNTTVALAA